MKVADVFKMRLKFYRTLEKLTLESLANEVKLSPTFISDLENGRRAPSLDTLEKLAEAFGIEAYQLLTSIDDKQEAQLKEFLRTLTISGEEIIARGLVDKKKPNQD